MSGQSIASIQTKFLEKIEQKYKGGVSKERLIKIFGGKDTNEDGFITLVEFKRAISESGNALSDPEAEFLFHFWDTMAQTQEPRGQVEVGLCVHDLISSQPQYGTGFRSGEDGLKANKGAKGNLPSQQGGIFGGQAPSMQQGRPPSSKRNSNQSSIPGGIFG